ncbi:unnamed protein product [Anisakis simplex]|uniref:WD repeat-containing protein 44 n=1 Tax=Anisakis simplex TaxID=6269 RepID=A0A158PPH4_ANISI|nr:unnamed protein product [Anisakis simplex]
MSSSSSSDEFEDAEDGLGPLEDRRRLSCMRNGHKISGSNHSAIIRSPAQTLQTTPVKSALIDEIDKRSELIIQQPSTSNYINYSSPLSPKITKTGDMPSSSSVSRRGRLSILRGRMRSEFGPSGVTMNCGGILLGDASSIEEETAPTSESASLASWGRNLLMEHSSVNVGPFFPSDSLSTKAFNPNVQSAEYLTGVPLVSPTADSDRAITSSTQRASSQSSTHNPPILSAIKPPSIPPPPLPKSPPPQSPSTELVRKLPLPPPTSIPPPLPPRNPALKLPAALPPQQIASIVSESSEKSPSMLASTTEPEPINKPAHAVPASSSLTNELSTTYRRGHAKTNSLDRGLSLAKSMKSGPFPPPSANKSNSLKRESSNDNTANTSADLNSFLSLDGGEEDLRNSDAQGIIHQITSSILNDEPLRDESSASDTPYTTALNVERIPSVNGEKVDNANNILIPSVSSGTSPSSDAPSTVIKTDNLSISAQQHQTNICLTPSDGDNEKDDTLTRESPNADGTLKKPVAVSPQAFIDPITRDVERRMSMKGHQRTEKGSEEDETASQTLANAGGLERATTLMKEYGSYASGLFRGALSRARHVVSSGGAVSKLPKEEEESCNESEKDETGNIDSTPIGAIWCMRFSLCGRLLATAGQDNIIRVWILRNHLSYFNKMREKYNSRSKKTSSVSLGEHSLQKAMQQIEDDFRSSSTTLGESIESSECHDEEASNESCAVMAPKPLCTYRGHTADVLDLSWSRNYFILSSGMDRTVKLWHVSRPECLCCFQHMDFVTCIAFMPKDDRYFLSGSLDGKLRLWHIPDKKVALWNEVEQVKFITAIAFVKNGRFAVVGTYDGRCFFYSTDQLKYHTVIDVRSTRGKNARGHKVTGLAVHGDKLLVTSNDSRIRMYDLRDMALTCKFKGAQNERSQIRASFSPDGKHIVCGSEDRYVYVWTTADLPSSLSVRKDRNDSWQRIRCHSACVSAAIFAPRPQLFLSLLEHRRYGAEERRYETGVHLKSLQERQLHGDVIISADLSGSIKILVNRTKIKAGSSNFFTTDIA